MKRIIFSIILLITILFLYGRYIEVYNFKIHEYTITNSNIPASFTDLKIVHFSDILYESGKNNDFLEDNLNKINEENPDIIIFSGDLFKNGESYKEEDYNFLETLLTNIDASLYKFAVIGDNDEYYIDKYKEILSNSGFILLDNENKLLFYKDNTPINIIGLTNLDNINELLTTDVSYNYSLVITHKPDNLTTLSTYNINTILSGHSLGGVINIPFYGGIIKKDGTKTYLNNYYTLNNTEMFISNGIGNEKYHLRLFNTPSFNVYRFSN